MTARRRPAPVPARLKRARGRFESWRRTRKVRRIPEELWKLATELATEYGVHRTARALRLNDDSLRKRLATTNTRSRTNSPTSSQPFVELLTAPIGAASEATIELEDGSGKILRIHLKGGSVPDLVALTSTLWTGDK